MKTSTRIILLIIFVVIVATGVTAGVIYLNNRDTDKEVEEKTLGWEEGYVEVLKDEKNFEELKDLRISLCDLDEDETPELIVFCSNAINEFMAYIYDIKENKVAKKEIAFDEEFDFEYIYNLNNEESNWYLTTEKTNEIYELKLEKDEDITADDRVEDKTNLISLGTVSKVEFEKTTEENKIKENLETAKQEYISNIQIKNTEEAKEKIQSAKVLKNVKKIDNTKGIVYSAREHESDNYANVIDKTFHNYYEYPAINIDSEDVKAINSEIEKYFGFTSEDEDYLFFMEVEVNTYDYYINGNILSVVVVRGGNDSTWSASYNVDITTGKRISNEELLFNQEISSSKKVLNSDEIKEKLKEYSLKAIDTSVAEMKKTIAQYWDESYEKEVTKLKEEVNKNLETLDNVYLNAEGNVCVRSEYQIFGGQFTCTKTIEIDAVNNIIKEIKFENYLNRGLGSQNK